MVFGITDLLTFILGTIVIVLLPGPNSLYVMTVGSRNGIAAGYRAAMGVFSGDLILIVLSSVGVASALKAMPGIYDALRYAGALYLAYLGFRLILSSWQSWKHRQQPHDVINTRDLKRGSYYRTALLISLLNPKAIVFYISFFIQFVDPGYAHPGLSFLILGTIVQLCSMIYLTLLILGGVYLANYFRSRQRLSAIANTAVGALFMGFGAKLATSS